MTSNPQNSLRRRDGRGFLGHPRGLGYLALAEGSERFSYYGTTALLALYGAQYLFQPGHIGRIWGFTPVRAILVATLGPMPAPRMSIAIAAIYGAVASLTPILGSLVADKLIGRTRAIIIGGVTLAIGHFCMAFEQTFLVALACILIGSGLFKANLAAQVGDLYASGDPRRVDAFQIYNLTIQIAVIASPIVCGFLAQKIAWRFGFGAAGAGMLISLIIYLAGMRWLPPETKLISDHPHARGQSLTPDEELRLIVLVLLVPVLALVWIGNQEIFAAYALWGDAHYQLTFMGWTMPASFLISIDAIASTATAVGTVIFWRLWGKRHAQPDEISKMAMGALLAAAAPFVLALASWHQAATAGKIGLGWGLGFHLLNGFGFALVYPAGMALYSRAAPKAVAATLMSTFLLSQFVAGLIVSKLTTLLGVISDAGFWSLHGALVTIAAAVLLSIRPLMGRLLGSSERVQRV